jgi:hypothetical protein
VDLAHPTQFERVTFAFGGQAPARNNAFNQPHESGIASAQVATTQCASLLRLTLRRPPTEIERLDGDQAERCDDNLPFASRLMALLSTTGHWAGQAFVEGEIPFSGGSSNGGFWSKKVENALSFNGD